IEMQADQLIREHELRQRDIMILRFDRQREFCDEIISKQRQLIDALSSGGTEHGKTTRELADLYRIYKLELDQLSNSREAVEKHLVSNPHRTYSVLGLRPLGSSESMVELQIITTGEKIISLPLINGTIEDKLMVLFIVTLIYQSTDISIDSQYPIRGKLFTPTCSSQGSRVDSGLSLSSYIQSLPSTPGDRLPPLSETDFVSNDDPVKILSRTRNISSLASRRREHSRESFLNGGYRNTSRRSTNSLNPNGETPPASVLGSRRSSSLSTRRESHDRLPNMSKYGVLPPIEHTGKRTKKNVRRLSKISTSDSESTMTDSQRTRLSTKPKGFGEMMGFSLAH
ncbi:kinesin-like protein KIF19, partial [Limulus polyphemus]|uniref:Kinesin-like protein KIF19 n=1 Tax=Limulus polyphemus TaxID=6850 RepID=A0ABM1TRC0_LIMPO